MVYRCFSQENDVCPYNESLHDSTGHRNYLPNWMKLSNITWPTIDFLRNECHNGTECADYGECNNTAIDGGSDLVCCSGAQSCVHSPIIKTINNDIHCDGVSSCEDAYIDISSGTVGDIYLTGAYGGSQSEIIASSQGSVYCSSRFGCLDANIHDAKNVYSLGKDSTTGGNIHNIENVYAYGFETLSLSNLTNIDRLMANAYSAVSDSTIHNIRHIYAWARYALSKTTVTGLYGGINGYMQYALNEVDITGVAINSCNLNLTQSVYVNCDYYRCGYLGTFNGFDYAIGDGYEVYRLGTFSNVNQYLVVNGTLSFFRGTFSNSDNECATEANGGSSLTCIGENSCKAVTVNGVTNITCSGLNCLANSRVTSNIPDGGKLTVTVNGDILSDPWSITCTPGDRCDVYCNSAYACSNLTGNCTDGYRGQCCAYCNETEGISCPQDFYTNWNCRPTNAPTTIPTAIPTLDPSIEPTNMPREPTNYPTFSPTEIPSVTPSYVPSFSPSGYPSNYPTISPTEIPPTDFPVVGSSPSAQPSKVPSDNPSVVPSGTPSNMPVLTPTNVPTSIPTNIPTNTPILGKNPTTMPTIQPTINPLFGTPSTYPTNVPTEPSVAPSFDPSKNPTPAPTNYPTIDEDFCNSYSIYYNSGEWNYDLQDDLGSLSVYENSDDKELWIKFYDFDIATNEWLMEIESGYSVVSRYADLTDDNGDMNDFVVEINGDWSRNSIYDTSGSKEPVFVITDNNYYVAMKIDNNGSVFLSCPLYNDSYFLPTVKDTDSNATVFSDLRLSRIDFDCYIGSGFGFENGKFI